MCIPREVRGVPCLFLSPICGRLPSFASMHLLEKREDSLKEREESTLHLEGEEGNFRFKKHWMSSVSSHLLFLF